MADRRRLARVPWRRLTTRPIYENRWIRMREDQVAPADPTEFIEVRAFPFDEVAGLSLSAGPRP